MRYPHQRFRQLFLWWTKRECSSKRGTPWCPGCPWCVKKSHRHSGQRLTEAVYTEVSAKVEAAKAAHRRVSISGMLKFLGVSRSGYRAFLRRKMSASQQHKKFVKEQIHKIYDKSNQNHGTPKITRELLKSGCVLQNVLSENTWKK